MRLDKYLKITRLIKRRTVANEACDGGRILVNGKVARASYAVKEGDTIEIQMGNRPVKGAGAVGQRICHQGKRTGDVPSGRITAAGCTQNLQTFRNSGCKINFF